MCFCVDVEWGLWGGGAGIMGRGKQRERNGEKDGCVIGEDGKARLGKLSTDKG